MFGESWDEAIAGGKVYNAMDGAAKLGVDGAGMDEKVCACMQQNRTAVFSVHDVNQPDARSRCASSGAN